LPVSNAENKDMIEIYKAETSRLNQIIASLEKQHMLDIQKLQEVFAAKEARLNVMLETQANELKSKEFEHATQLNMAKNQIKVASAVASNSNSDVIKVLNEVSKISTQLNTQLESLKQERSQQKAIVDYDNLLKEKEAQVNFLINKVKVIQSAKTQLEESTKSDKTIIRTLVSK
jgi:hypothetical protein